MGGTLPAAYTHLGGAHLPCHDRIQVGASSPDAYVHLGVPIYLVTIKYRWEPRAPRPCISKNIDTGFVRKSSDGPLQVGTRLPLVFNRDGVKGNFPDE